MKSPEKSRVAPRTPRKGTAIRLDGVRRFVVDDLRRGSYIVILHEVVEIPGWLIGGPRWDAEPSGMLRLEWTQSEGIPLKVRDVCLPYLLTREWHGKPRMVDTRMVHLGIVNPRYAQKVWKAHARAAKTV